MKTRVNEIQNLTENSRVDSTNSFKKRREFLEFMGRGSALAALATLAPFSLTNCVHAAKHQFSFRPMKPQTEDLLFLNEGLQSDVLIKWQDRINEQGDFFGYDNDYIGFVQVTQRSGYLWVNHEACNPVFIHDGKEGGTKSRENFELERKNVGGSLLWIEKKENNKWELNTSASVNTRFDGTTSIDLHWHEPILGQRKAKGTFANCSGGVTPWGTFLTCEENYQNHYGEVEFISGKRIHHKITGEKSLRWCDHEIQPPEHYGWVVEVDPKTKKAKKLIALGRFAHEGALVVTAHDGRLVVYSGDDKDNECIYKFISAKPGSLDHGTLYVADTVNGKWLPLDLKLSPILQKYFKSQTEVMIRTREAAKILGGTPLDRPEGMDRDPKTGAIYCALTNNKKRGNLYGSLLKIEEPSYTSTELKASIFIAGGPDSGFACPDNITFDRNGNLWMTTDVSDSALNKNPYKEFGNNGLYYVPMSGPDAGRALRIAVGPIESEICSPRFLDNGTLLISVQHPGGNSKSLSEATSHWPDGGTSIAKPAVVAITGPLLTRLLS